MVFKFDNVYLEAFRFLKRKVALAPIIVAPNWNLPFELMCDVSDSVVGTVLGQCKEKVFYTIYYASKILSDAQLNYATTERSFLWLSVLSTNSVPISSARR